MMLSASPRGSREGKDFMSARNLAVVSGDTDVELRDGHLKFDFAFVGKPVITHGQERIVPDYGFATMSMTDGRWQASFVHIEGYRAKVRSDEPTQKKARIAYPFDFTGEPTEEGDLDTWHPDYAPPGWLVSFIHGFQDRLNATAPPKAIEAARQLPEAKREDFDPMTLRILTDLLPDPDALDAALRIFNPQTL